LTAERGAAGGGPVHFREMTEADVESGLRLSRASGWNQTADDWHLLLSLGQGLFRVGVADGHVVASGGAVRYGEVLAWICMILVDPACRGQGLGTRVFDEVLARVRRLVDAGQLATVGLDATPAGRGIYLLRGFAEGPALVRMAAEPMPAAHAPHHGPVRPMAPADLEAVLDLDRAASGLPRATVLHRALASAPGLARVFHGGGRVRGFCLGRHGDRADHVGPVVAEDGVVAHELVAACLAQPRARPLIVDARLEPGWLAALRVLGFQEQRPFTRMYLQDRRPAAQPALEWAVRGPEFA
jgi:GNAT superfamily N-acetyltransferase